MIGSHPIQQCKLETDPQRHGNSIQRKIKDCNSYDHSIKLGSSAKIETSHTPNLIQRLILASITPLHERDRPVDVKSNSSGCGRGCRSGRTGRSGARSGARRGGRLTCSRLASAALRSSGAWLSAARSTTTRLGRSIAAAVVAAGGDDRERRRRMRARGRREGAGWGPRTSYGLLGLGLRRRRRCRCCCCEGGARVGMSWCLPSWGGLASRRLREARRVRARGSQAEKRLGLVS